MTPIEIMVYFPASNIVTVIMGAVGAFVIFKVVWKLIELIPGM